MTSLTPNWNHPSNTTRHSINEIFAPQNQQATGKLFRAKWLSSWVINFLPSDNEISWAFPKWWQLWPDGEKIKFHFNESLSRKKESSEIVQDSMEHHTFMGFKREKWLMTEITVFSSHFFRVNIKRVFLFHSSTDVTN